MSPKARLLSMVAATLVFRTSLANADIVIEQGWVRATVPGAPEAAGYLTITNTGAESRTLLRLTSTITDTVTIHQSSIDAQGMARMWPVAKLEIKAGETLKFEPNGRHLMLRALQAPLRVGEKVPVTFQFDRGAEPVTVQLTVRPLVDDAAIPAASGAAHHHH